MTTQLSEIISLHKIAIITILLCMLSIFLTWTSVSSLELKDGPIGVVFAQVLWNAIVVSQLLMLFGIFSIVNRQWYVKLLALITFLLLPFSSYLISPGGVALAIVVLITSLIVILSSVTVLNLHILNTNSVSDTPSFRFESVALVCNLGSSMYNYNASKECFPHWDAIFHWIARLLGITIEPKILVEKFYTLGIENVPIPSFIPLANGNNFGAIIFLSIWTVFPFFYILYFGILFHNSKKSYGARFQQALCLFGIFHFLFLTDLVDYKFGRGITNHYAEWFHWSERFVWRTAILLPIYQKVSTGELKERYGKVGIFLHYSLAIWACIFLIYQVLVYDFIRFYHFALGIEPSNLLLMLKKNYIQELGYHGALVIMVLVYGAMWFGSNNRIIIKTNQSTL